MAGLEPGVGPARRGIFGRLRDVLAPGADPAAWDGAEEILLAADVGPSLGAAVIAGARRRGGPALDAVAAELRSILGSVAPAWDPRPAVAGQPQPVLIVGVNGTGKTTTIAKLARYLQRDGRTVLLAGADTFRAAAIEQLRTWAERLDVPMIAHAPGADPGAVVFDALDAATARGIEVVIADTAGRLHTKRDLMDELAKVRRVIDRRLPGSKPDVLLVLDATTGQNGLHQARVFHEIIGLTGLVVTKLDSTARAGILFAIARELSVPVLFLGVGERLDDLRPFDPDAFVEALFAA